MRHVADQANAHGRFDEHPDIRDPRPRDQLLDYCREVSGIELKPRSPEAPKP